MALSQEEIRLAGERTVQDAHEIVARMKQRNPQIMTSVGLAEGVTLEEFAIAIIVQWKTRHLIPQPL